MSESSIHQGLPEHARRRQVAELDDVTNSEAAPKSLAENYLVLERTFNQQESSLSYGDLVLFIHLRVNDGI